MEDWNGVNRQNYQKIRSFNFQNKVDLQHKFKIKMSAQVWSMKTLFQFFKLWRWQLPNSERNRSIKFQIQSLKQNTIVKEIPKFDVWSSKFGI